MVDRIPSGTRDVLPDEMRELRAMTDRVRAVFETAGYGEVYTPALEYEQTFSRNEMLVGRPAYRVFDELGNVLVLRSDMTVPIARLVATRYRDAEPPLRFCYFAHAYRGVRPQRGQAREFLQAGIELIGAESPEGTAEVLPSSATPSPRRASRPTASAWVTPRCTRRCWTVSMSRIPSAASASSPSWPTVISSGSSTRCATFTSNRRTPPCSSRCRAEEAGLRCFRTCRGPLEHAVTGMRAVHALLAPEVADRIIFDFGLVRGLGYYTGAVFQVYDPAYGVPIGIGGRYDELLGRFGRALPAVGFALNVERLHIALTGEERGKRA